jgi:hypothetical protein
MVSRHRAFLAPLVLALAMAPGIAAQPSPVTVKEETPGLLKQAKITPAVATRTALAKFPTGSVVSGELEQEGGRLIYSFDIQQAGVQGIEEVHVDAISGAVIKTEHENPAAELREEAKPEPPVKKP